MTVRDTYSLYLDLQISQSPFYSERGSVRYAVEHARAMIKRTGLVSGISLNPTMPFPAALHPELRRFRGLHWAGTRPFSVIEAEGPLAYFMLSPFAPGGPEFLLPPYALKAEVPLIVTLVDLTPLTSTDPLFAKPDVALRYRSRFQMIEQADLVLTISENTRSLALELLPVSPQQVVNIGTGVSDFFGPAETLNSQALVSRNVPSIRKPFVLSLTGTWEWKNTHRLIEAYSQLPRDLRDGLQLVVVCRLNDEYREKWMALALACGLQAEDLVLTDLVTDATLRALYRSARLFVYPSLYEGFGLPAAEAAACGCPAIVSNTSSLPEILDYPPATFDPEDPQDIAALMERALSSETFNAQLVAASKRAAERNTWEAVVDKTAAALSLLRPPRSMGKSPGEHRPRIAFASAFSGSVKTAGGKNVELALELSKLCELDIAAAGSVNLNELRQVTGARCFPLHALGKWLNPAAYNAILYNLGGKSGGEIAMKADAYPGVIMVGSETAADLHPTFGHYVRSPSSRALRAATGVIASSEHQANMVAFDVGPQALAPPIAVVDDAVPAADIAAQLLGFLSWINEA